MSRLGWAPVLAAAALLGCSSCPAPLSTASALGEALVLDGATPAASHHLLVHAPEQDCGCTWCGDPVLSLALSGQAAWSSPSEASDYPMVRFSLAPDSVLPLNDTLEPPLPVDVVLTPGAPSSEVVLRATHLCPSSDPCDLSYALTIARVDAAPAGPVDVLWFAGVRFPSQSDGSLSVAIAP